ncbi:MAG: CidA/LrgA family protein [Chloroherpetonaceae bacterium]|nr:CidA/LrgA family protein [Chloroherpetonaceae bacterium]MCS7211705.1 CidA/LrgA family protein [Chloroherpetonaceae bacterium]MDW8018643.1 CidA/LrgA family protein [Chloroherpetonaceae bacterium]MDW8465404.1 CidA/LrgA family protein [Chloroherpetonaceae bacterium]
MVQGFAILFLLLLAGEIISRTLGLPIPGSIIGLLLLLLSLSVGAVKLEWIKPASDVLLRNLSLFFVPPGVGLMLYAEPLRQYVWVILLVIVLSMLAVMAVVALMQERLEKML